MTNPTSNYSWQMPTSTDLVTDLPADFEVFGQAVDTTTKALNPSTTLGDIEYRSSTANTNTRLGIGSTGQVLTVAGGVPSWATAGGGGLTSIASGSLSGTQISLTSIPATYVHLQLIVSDYFMSLNDDSLVFRMNLDNTAQYSSVWTKFTGSSGVVNYADGGGYYGTETDCDDTSKGNKCILNVYDYKQTTGRKLINTITTSRNNANQVLVASTNGLWRDTSAVNSIQIRSRDGGTFSGGTYVLYGVQ
jgi:hypothetical protein